eukprot:389212_1
MIKLLLLFCLLVQCSCQGLRTLVVLESLSLKQTHSTFFSSLKERGHILTFKAYDDRTLKLQTHGEYNFDNLVIFGSKIDAFGGSLDSAAIMAYLDAGHNLMFAVDERASDAMRGLANEFGFDFDAPKTVVHDHANHDTKSGLPTDSARVLTDAWIDASPIVGARGESRPTAPVLYRGIAHALDRESKLVFSILQGRGSIVSSDPHKKLTARSLKGVGRDVALVSALQGRNNARATIIGSLDMCSDAFYFTPVQGAEDKKSFSQSGNREFCTNLAMWTFKETGVLRATNIVHHLAANKTELNPPTYRAKDKLRYSVDISEWSVSSQDWQPFRATDVQLELVRMDPFQLRTMQTDGNGKYWAEFRVPHHFGIFHLTIDYRRRGYTHLTTSDQIGVRHFMHSEHPRFIPAAYPYYAGAFSMLAGFFVFAVVFLYGGGK